MTLRVKITEDDEILFDRDVRFIAAYVNIDTEESCDIQVGMCTRAEQAALCVKLLMMIEDIFEEEPMAKKKVSKLMENDYDEIRKMWKEDHSA